MKKKIVILGSTGSIGINTLEVLFFEHIIENEFEVVGIACSKNIGLISAQARKYNIPNIAILNDLKSVEVPVFTKVHNGKNSFYELIERTKPDIIVNAVSGSEGLKYTKFAIENSIDVALANKESLVMGGNILIDLAKKNKSRLIPVDSEHSAIHQLLYQRPIKNVRNVIITGSGGPFLNLPKDEFENILPENALKHPKWVMGAKITIDSATFMNKGLEVIEAHYLFGLTKNKIKVLIHPESIVHGMIEMNDGSFFAQLASPDMKGPIAYSIFGEKRISHLMVPVDFEKLNSLHFYKPDFEKFPLLNMAYSVLGNPTETISMNAGNELSVYAFLEKKIKFNQIFTITESCVQKFQNIKINCFDDIFLLQNEVEIFFKRDLV